MKRRRRRSARRVTALPGRLFDVGVSLFFFYLVVDIVDGVDELGVEFAVEMIDVDVDELLVVESVCILGCVDELVVGEYHFGVRGECRE